APDDKPTKFSYTLRLDASYPSSTASDFLPGAATSSRSLYGRNDGGAGPSMCSFGCKLRFLQLGASGCATTATAAARISRRELVPGLPDDENANPIEPGSPRGTAWRQVCR